MSGPIDFTNIKNSHYNNRFQYKANYKYNSKIIQKLIIYGVQNVVGMVFRTEKQKGNIQYKTTRKIQKTQERSTKMKKIQKKIKFNKNEENIEINLIIKRMI